MAGWETTNFVSRPVEPFCYKDECQDEKVGFVGVRSVERLAGGDRPRRGRFANSQQNSSSHREGSD